MANKSHVWRILRSAAFVSFGVGMLISAQDASAVPSFARQTGMSCAACHTVFPKLTPFGRVFKLNGYTMTGLKQIEAKEGISESGLKINAIAPMSAMVQTALSHISSPDSNTENDNIAFPSALSLYYAGEISDHMGAFIQVTMDDAGSSFGFDMADMRYAKATTTTGGTSLTYGVTLDNMTGMEDVWNTTPSWTYPYLAASPDHGDSPAVNSLMGAGLGAYAMVDNHWYAYLSLYDPMDSAKTMDPMQSGTNYMAMGNPHSLNPYWRLAWQGNVGDGGYLEVGTYGTSVQVYGSGMAATAAGATAAALAKDSDKFTDTALDAQYELAVGGGNQINAHAVYIHEGQTLSASNPTATSQHINQLRGDIAYEVGGRYQYQFGYFSTTGSSGAYAFDGMNANAYGGDANGYVAEVDYLPWENTKFSVQYTAYNKMGGTSSGASDNNTLVLNTWFMW